MGGEKRKELDLNALKFSHNKRPPVGRQTGSSEVSTFTSAGGSPYER